MTKAKFTYDESGATFSHFVLSFLALILIPTTYHLWPNKSPDDDSQARCKCNGCQTKQQHLNDLNKRKKSFKTIVRGAIVIGWLVFALIAYKCATAQNEYVNWDPFEILGVHEGASLEDIKRAYRKLSLIHHPDKGSSTPDKFVSITKAYAALTNEEARKNWEQYGNPDGPTFASYGIALPSWIVEKENSFVVLGIYALIFMVALPVSVGTWWYRSMKFGTDKVLLNTCQLYYHYINLTPNMALKRVIMILAASLEFAKSHNPEIIERPTDNTEVPRLIRDIPLTGIEKNKERPLCFSYSVKARAILHAHLSRMRLPQTTLEVDRIYIIKKCPYLIQEFVHCTSQLITLALAGRIPNMPNLFTLENAMKLGPMMIQALWEYQNPLLQLPHFTEETLKSMERRRIKIRTMEQLARMKLEDRRKMLKNFTDSQIEDIEHVLGSLPIVQIDCKFEVLDDEDPNIITAHSIVTVIVKLKRVPMRVLFNEGSSRMGVGYSGDNEVIQEDKPDTETKHEENDKSDDAIDCSKDEKDYPNQHVHGKKTNQQVDDSKKHFDEEDWDKKFQEKVIKKHKIFESKPKNSHPVHCPYFPDHKQEFWWVYIVDKKRFALVTAPLLVTNLIDTEEVELKFSAPNVGVYSYTIVVRSDSYVDCTVSKQTKVEVKPAKEYVEVDYDIPDDKIEEDIEEEHSSVEDSDLLTDSDQD